MATVVLLRHGRTTANASGTLAGRTAGVRLDATGRDQAARAGERLAGVPLVAVVTSPLERCRQTARAVLAAQGAQGAQGARGAQDAAGDRPPLLTERGLAECDYGEWQGRSLAELAQEPLWRTVQAQPSAVTFPGGESMRAMQARAVEAVRRHDAAVQAEHGAHAVWVAVSHGDLIKAVLADALGMHLDAFQRLHVDPASLSVVRYTESRPFVLSTNTQAGDLAWLAARPEEATSQDAAVGGGAGPGGHP